MAQPIEPAVPHYLRDHVTLEELQQALITGTRPVYFQENENAPLWGGGSMFIAQWKGRQFAITAKHVFTNSKADPKHTRVLFPGFPAALPLKGVRTPRFPGFEATEDLEDMVALEVNQDFTLDGEEMHWYAWNMDTFWRSAKDLKVNQQLFAVGYPTTSDRYDWENQKVTERPMVAVGVLGRDSLGEGTYCIDTAPFDFDIDGCSGGPVFARFDGFFQYVGLIIRGGAAARKIYFVDATFVTFLLNDS